MGYRGDGEPSAERLAQLDERIAALEARFTDEFWDSVANVWRVPRALGGGLSPLEARHDRLDRLQDAIERASNGLAAEPELPLAPETSLEPHAPRAAKGFLEAIRRYAPDAELLPREGGGWGTRVYVDEAPVNARLIQIRQGRSWMYAFEFETSVAPSARLSLKQEGTLQDLLELVGVRTEIELGDPDFDPIFIIEGDEATARLFLTTQVRRRLLQISVEVTPYVSVVGGRAMMRTMARGAKSNRCALRAVAAWHHLSSPHPLLA